MKKFTLLRIGKCYFNKNDNFAVAVLEGNRRTGYVLSGSHADRHIGIFTLKSRVIPNSGEWKEINHNEFRKICISHNGNPSI